MANNKAFKIKNGLLAGRYLGSNGTIASGTLDLSTGNIFSFTQSGATTVSFTNPPASGTAIGFLLVINSDGNTITWPSSVKWHQDTTPVITPTVEAYAFVTVDGGTTYYGIKTGENLV